MTSAERQNTWRRNDFDHLLSSLQHELANPGNRLAKEYIVQFANQDQILTTKPEFVAEGADIARFWTILAPEVNGSLPNFLAELRAKAWTKNESIPSSQTN